ncbi:hypothetical protein B566_EDAN007801 [Ephemera danica]|nr:hypothetical protein B566_EDAN007801 [Ephemera danica]
MMLSKFPNFCEEKDDIELYLERLESCFEVDNIAPDKQVHALIVVLGSSAYKELRNNCYPGYLPSEKTFEECKQLLILRYKTYLRAAEERNALYTINDVVNKVEERPSQVAAQPVEDAL